MVEIYDDGKMGLIKYHNEAVQFEIPNEKPFLQKLTLTWEHINVYKSAEKNWLFKKSKKNEEKRLIQNFEGIARPGELLAIMGASGAGKTTLLNVLTCRDNGDLTITGSVRINGKLIRSASQIASVSGYVQQDDIFIGTLKVKEHLMFQAMLKMDSSNSKAQKENRVRKVLNDLNLKTCEDTLIGSPELMIKGISGGERRRLSFASEIITDPAILFCDEPTSGLDSFMAMTVVESMKRLAAEGRTIICTIHQPSSEIFRSFNSLYLLAEGRLAYSGSLPGAYEFFASQGFKCPPRYNPADFYIKNLAISPFNKEKSYETLKAISYGFSTSPYSQEIKKEISAFNDSDKENNQFTKTSSSSANWLTQMSWLIWRESISRARNPRETKIALTQSIIIAVLLGLIYFKTDLDQPGVQNINGILFIICVNSSFSSVFPILNSLLPVIPLFLRENKKGMYTVFNFFFARFLVDIPRFTLIPLVFVSIVYWMAGFSTDFEKYLIVASLILLCSVIGCSFGTFVSTAAPNIGAALGISATIQLPLMIFGGLFINRESIPSYLVWLRYMSWINYANENLGKKFGKKFRFEKVLIILFSFFFHFLVILCSVINQWMDIEFIKCPNVNSTNCFTNGKEVIAYLGSDESRYYSNFLALLGILIGWRILGFLVLLRRSYMK